MTSLFDRLNLRPNERRLVVVTGIVLFVLLNLAFVRPHFHDWSKTEIELGKSRDTLELYKKEIAKTKEYETKQHELESQGGAIVKTEEQSSVLMQTIHSQAQLSRVGETGLRPVGVGASKTNQFYEEQAYVINFETGDRELVDFLFALGNGSSMVRVRNIDLRPDVSGMKLSGSATLVASYQRKAPLTASTVVPGARPNPSAKPAPPKTSAGAVGVKPANTTTPPKTTVSTPAPLGGARRGGPTNAPNPARAGQPATPNATRSSGRGATNSIPSPLNNRPGGRGGTNSVTPR